LLLEQELHEIFRASKSNSRIIRAGEEYKKFENSSGIIPRIRKIDRTNEDPFSDEDAGGFQEKTFKI
jgi:hypothetical protein